MLINLIFICFISALALISIKNFVSSIKNSRKDKINKNKSLIVKIAKDLFKGKFLKFKVSHNKSLKNYHLDIYSEKKISYKKKMLDIKKEIKNHFIKNFTYTFNLVKFNDEDKKLQLEYNQKLETEKLEIKREEEAKKRKKINYIKLVNEGTLTQKEMSLHISESLHFNFFDIRYKMILDELVRNIEEEQKSFPNNWWKIIETDISPFYSSKILIKSKVEEKQNIDKIIKKSLNHHDIYNSKSEWDLKNLEHEIGLLISRYSEIVSHLMIANFKINDECDGMRFSYKFDDYVIAAYSRLNGILMFAISNGFSNSRIKEYCKKDVFDNESIKFFRKLIKEIADDNLESFFNTKISNTSEKNSKKLNYIKLERELYSKEVKIQRILKESTTYRLNPDDINIKDSKIIARKSQKKKTKGVEKANKIIAKIKKTENTKEEYFDNGELRTLVSLDLNELSHGICLELYSNGNVNKIQNFKHGVPHGSSKKYFNNGKIHDDYVFKNGFMHGIQTTFYDNGNKDIITHYKNGRAHGICEQYYPCGNLETKSIYEEGKIEGVHVHYKENGEPLEQQIFHNGNDITFELFEHLMKNEEHTIKSGLIKEGVQNPIETLENIYDYLKNNDFTLNDKTF